MNKLKRRYTYFYMKMILNTLFRYFKKTIKKSLIIKDRKFLRVRIYSKNVKNFVSVKILCLFLCKFLKKYGYSLFLY